MYLLSWGMAWFSHKNNHESPGERRLMGPGSLEQISSMDSSCILKAKMKQQRRKLKGRQAVWPKWCFSTVRTQISDLVICLFLLYQRHIVKLVNGKEKCLTDNIILYVKYHLCIEFWMFLDMEERKCYGISKFAFFAVFILGRVWQT